MKHITSTFSIALVAFLLCISASGQANDKKPTSTYDEGLAKKLGADERGMKMFVLCILKTGPKDAEFKGKERDDIFAGHFANIGNLAEQGKLAVAGPFGKNDKTYRGLYIFNVTTIAEAEKLVVMDPAVKAGVFVPELTLWYGSAAMMTVNDVHKKIEKPATPKN
ncbi:MAG: YciI family protein [Pyrinomonadaceae bacterium]